jgi:hypothetical protein
MTFDDLCDALGAFEPDYPRLAAEWGGPDGVKHLRTLVSSNDWGLAAKAAYLAALIGDKESVEIASNAQNQYVRVAAAAAAPDLSFTESMAILRQLSTDPNPRVNAVANRVAASNTRVSHLNRRIRRVASRIKRSGPRFETDRTHAPRAGVRQPSRKALGIAVLLGLLLIVAFLIIQSGVFSTSPPDTPTPIPGTKVGPPADPVPVPPDLKGIPVPATPIAEPPIP